jgi:mannose-1-phosphate guanylyltransferase/mannose-1-phosphate guanylyltransferase/phosphomannomutase
MRVMVMAAGLGTRLRPLTYEIPKPIVPVANRPVAEHLLRLLARQGFTEVIANLHWFPDTIEATLGDGSAHGVALTYRREEELLGTAGGVRNVADFLMEGGDSFVVMAGDALTDVDLAGLVRAHQSHGGVATLAVRRVANVSEYGVVITGSDGRIQGFQEKPDPAEALSDLANCMIYAFRPEVFEYFPDDPAPDFAKDVFPILLEHDVPFHAHTIDAYWNDVGSLPEYLQGNLDALEGAVEVDPSGERMSGSDDEEIPAPQEGGWTLSGSALVGEGAEIGAGARLDGPLVIAPGARIGENACVRRSVLLAGTRVPPDALVAGAIVGARGALVP